MIDFTDPHVRLREVDAQIEREGGPARPIPTRERLAALGSAIYQLGGTTVEPIDVSWDQLRKAQ
jgi:hypothetical protein